MLNLRNLLTPRCAACSNNGVSFALAPSVIPLAFLQVSPLKPGFGRLRAPYLVARTVWYVVHF